MEPQFLVQTSWRIVQVSSAATAKMDEILQRGLEGTTQRFRTVQYVRGHNPSNVPEEARTTEGPQALLTYFFNGFRELVLQVGKEGWWPSEKSWPHSTP